MIKTLHTLAIFTVTTLVLASCSLTGTSTQSALPKMEPTASLSQLVKIELAVQADTSVPFTAVGQNIKYTYTIKNAGSTGVPASAPGSVTVTGAAVTCPEVITIGNKDGTLDANEPLICASTYPITQADFDKGSITNITTATVNGISSPPVTTTVNISKAGTLKLTKTAAPASYDQAGQTITYTYVITNISAAALGPAQFIVTDTGISAPINCGAAATTLAPSATVTCTAVYTTTQTDASAASFSTNATASGGTGASEPAGVTVTKAGASNLTAGATIQHQVTAGEWLWQIARCYGADPTKVLQANPQITNPGMLTIGATITVPNIGSAGKIYKTANTPCVGTHTVQTGDTWDSIAQKYNADVTVLKKANATILTVGQTLNIPLNSAGAVGSAASTSGNCVDLTRTIRWTNVQANITHFNVCGQTLASGNMKIATIKVYQRPEDVGLGGFTQDITLPAVDTSTPLGDANSLIVADINYDGNDDFRIVRDLPAGPNIPYVYYIYDPATVKFVYSEAYGKITSPEFPGNGEIRSKWRESAAKWGTDTYKITNNIPALTQREIWEAINATQAKHTITVMNADGTSQVTLDETIPIPVQ